MTAVFDERLRQAAAALADAQRTTAIKQSVARFVRLNRVLLVELHKTAGSWTAVAGLLAAEGLRWRDGRKVTGPQLRSLASSTRPKSKDDALARPASAPRPPARSPVADRSQRPTPSLSHGTGLASLLDVPTASPRER